LDDDKARRRKRFSQSKRRIRAAFEMADPVEPPVNVWPLHYIIFGTEPERIPEDIFERPGAMMEFQTRICEQHLRSLDDDFIPYLCPYYGTGVLASAFGVRMKFRPNRDPSAGPPCITTAEDVASMKPPDPERSGLMPRVLEAAAYMRDHGDYPVALTDSQSPLDEIVLMVGHERLYFWMYDEPQMVHDLFTLVTDAFIEWVTAQKAVTGEPMDECRGEQGVWVPPGTGVWIADDEAVNLPPNLYAEFVAPQYERIFAAFNSGVLHWCGPGAHLGGILQDMQHLACLNTGPMGQPALFADMQRALGGKVPMIYQEFTPVDPESYFRDLISRISLRGVVIAPIVTDLVATGAGENAGFVEVKQDRHEAARRNYDAIQTAIAEVGAADRETVPDEQEKQPHSGDN